MSKIIQVGHSLAVTIPSQFVKNIGAKHGDNVKVTQKPFKGRLILTFKDMRQLPLLK